MPCSCFGKKDKKGGVLGEEEKYRPRDSRERDNPSQTQPLLGKGPKAQPLGNPPASSPTLAKTTPSSSSSSPGEARLRPEDDPDKVSRRRDVVASFYSDQCELIDFKTTGSRPPSANVGGHQDGKANNQDGPAATSSPATSSPSSTRSGAFCRADLAEKRREFFKDLTTEDETRGSRPTSRLTDPGSQQTPRHSQYQDQLHHTLPHLNKISPRSNNFSATPLVVQHSLHRNSTPFNSSPEDKQPLSLHSSLEQSPKINSNSQDLIVSGIPQQPSLEVVSASDSEDIPLLSHELSSPDQQIVIGTSVSETIQHEISAIKDHTHNGHVENTEPNSPEFSIGISPIDSKNSDINIVLPTESVESSKFSFESSPIVNEINENTSSDNPQSINILQQNVVIDPFILNSELSTCTENKNNANVEPLVVDSHLFTDNTPIEPILQLDSHPGDSSLQSHDNQFNVEFSHDSVPSTLPVIINETLKEFPNNDLGQKSFEITPHNTQISFESHPEQTSQTIVETTRQFISGSPDEQKPAETIVETTRKFITGPTDDPSTHSVVETTQQYITVTSDDQDPPQTFVETTRQFISGVPDNEETSNLVETTSQFLSGLPTDEGIVKMTQHQFVSGDPDDDTFSQTIVKTTQQLISGNPDETVTRTTVETTQNSSTFPAPIDNFFLTSVEEPEELPDKSLVQTTTITTNTIQESRSPFSSLQEEDDDVEIIEEPRLPDVPCFGAPPPPSSPPPPLPDGQLVEDPFSSPSAIVLTSAEPESLPPAPPTPPADQQFNAEEHQFEYEVNTVPLTPPSPASLLEGNQELPPAPPTPPTPRLDDVQLLPSENEQLPPTPPTPPREDELPAEPSSPPKEIESSKVTAPDSPTATHPPTITLSTPSSVTCGVEISSSALEDDGIGSEIDDIIEPLEGLSEEGNIDQRAAASS